MHPSKVDHPAFKPVDPAVAALACTVPKTRVNFGKSFPHRHQPLVKSSMWAITMALANHWRKGGNNNKNWWQNCWPDKIHLEVLGMEVEMRGKSWSWKMADCVAHQGLTQGEAKNCAKSCSGQAKPFFPFTYQMPPLILESSLQKFPWGVNLLKSTQTLLGISYGVAVLAQPTAVVAAPEVGPP